MRKEIPCSCSLTGLKLGKQISKAEKVFTKPKPLRIGWTYEEARPTQSPFVGFIDEVRIWNVARTEAEIRADMNTELTGNEPGLVAYWKFDELSLRGKDGIVPDMSPNKNAGRLMGSAKLGPYTRPIFENSRPEQLTQAAAAYESALQLEPNFYELYSSLAQIHKQSEYPLNAEDVYRRALGASLTQSEHEAAVKAILDLYPDDGHAEKHIALLEALKPKMANSAFLYEHLGDAYKKAGDAEKAESAYNRWLKIRKKEVNESDYYWYYHQFAEKLLNKGLYPETALEFAKRATLTETDSRYILTLGQAYLANEQYEEAFQALSGTDTEMLGYIERGMFWQIAQIGKNTKDKAGYINMMHRLIDAMPHKPTAQLNAHLVLAEFHRANDMPEKAAAHLQKTGFITKDGWLVLGPFDNSDGIGYDTPYIQENSTPLDLTTKHDGVNEQVSWKKFTDAALDGYIHLGEQNVDWHVSYAFATLTSPDERKHKSDLIATTKGKSG